MITTKERSWNVEDLKGIPVIKEEYLGNRWKGIQHGELVETIHNGLSAHGIQIVQEGWYPSGPNLGRLNGRMQLLIPNVEPMEGTAFNLGVQHSNLGDHSLKFAVGAEVFICSNGMVVGDYAIKKRHTLNVDLPEVIGRGIDTYLNRIAEIPIVAKEMKGKGLERDQVDHHLMQAGREGLMTWSRIGAVDKEYHKPTFRDHDERTAWGLYNAFTFVIQKSPAHRQIKGINRFREILLGSPYPSNN